MFWHAPNCNVLSPSGVRSDADPGRSAPTPPGPAAPNPAASGLTSPGTSAARYESCAYRRRRGLTLSFVALVVGLALVVAAPVSASSGYSQWAPNVAPSVQTIAQRFGVQATTYPGHDPDQWHAADFLVHSSDQGYALAGYAKVNAARLRVHYICWHQHIWNIQRAAEGWRLMADRGSPTQNHMDHVHVSFY
ncbi:MAG TPA: hypothetical protein VFN75_06510 [Pseudonocardiaceae bacterium]|nr:hypothetical protein [Pseudonocardiaceae bacterium]